MSRPLGSAWFELIEKYTNHWGRTNDRELYLWFSGVAGSDPNYWDAMEAIKNAKGTVISEKFDRLCGKTCCRVLEPKEVLKERKETMNE